MANPPPPYDNITGISRAVMKDNAQETLGNYNGNARPGELVVDLTQDPPPLYVGNNAGRLTLVSSGGGGAGLPLANGSSNFDIATSGGNATITVGGGETWTFDTNSNLTLPNGGAIVLENGDGVISKDGDDLLISWDDEELILRSVNGDVQLEAENDVEIRSGYNFGTGDYGSRWIFNNNGELQSIPQDTANSSSYNGGYIQFVGNSSGDGGGYTTIVLRPDETVSGDQNIVIDPTAPNHIHIRAGGPQDNSLAQLFLGGELSQFSVGAGNAPPLYLKANDNQWTFGTDGNLTFPGGDASIVPDLGGTTAFQGAANTGVVMTSSGNVGSVTMSWLDQTTDLANARTASMTLNVGGTANAQIQIANLASNTVSNWNFEVSGKLSVPGPIQMAVYANATVRDAAITSPAPGMMIYVTGTGMQVRGATSWNTIAGSGT